MSILSSLTNQTEEPVATVASGQIAITPRVIDFGHRLIQMGQVSRVDLGLIYPGRGSAIVSVALCFGFLVVAGGARGSDPAMFLMLAVLAAIGAAWNWQRSEQFLLITTSDGRRLQISADRAFLLQILARIRDAMQFEPHRDIRYTVNFAAKNIEIGSVFDQSSATVVDSPGGQAIAGDVGPASQDSTKPNDSAFNNAATNGSFRNGGMANSAARGATYTIATLPPAAAYAPTIQPAPVARSANVSNAVGGIAVAGDIGPGARVHASVSLHDELGQLIALLERHNIAHRAEIVQLLRVVEGHVAAGPARRADALATWRHFAD